MNAPSRYSTLAQRYAGRPIWDNLDPAEQARREAGFSAALRARDMVDEYDACQALESSTAAIVEPRWSSRTVTTASPIAEAVPIAEVSTPPASTAIFEPCWARARR